MITKIIVLLFTGFSFIQSISAFTNAGEFFASDNTHQTDSSESKDSAVVYHQLWKRLSNAHSGGNLKNIAESYAAIADYHREYGHIDSALSYLQNVETIYLEHGNRTELAQTYLALKEIYNLKADYLEAMNLVYKALEIFESLKDEKGIAVCYSSIADLLYYSDRLEQSVEYSKKAIAIQKKLGLKRDLANSYYAKACPELFIYDRLDSALVSINIALDIYREIGESGFTYMKALNWRGNVYKYLGRYDDALMDYQSNLENAKRQNINHYELASYANIGHVYILEGDYAKALPYNLKAIAIMKETGDTENLWENYMHVADAYEHLGQTDSALAYQKRYIEVYDSYLQSIIARLESETQIKYETQKKDEQLDAQAAELFAQENLEKRYIGIAIFLIFALFIVLFSYRKRQQRNRQLAILNSKLDSRNKQNELLMKEIHHRVKNNLEMVKSLLALQSAKLEDPASREAIMAGQSRVQSMGIIHQKLYKGDNLDSIEMKDYFINLSQEILDSYDANDRVKINCEMQPLEINVDIAQPIGLIVNELISNSLKYAFPEGKNGEIQISLLKKMDGLHLKVSDNGVGYELGSAPKGTGFGSELVDLLTRQLNGVLCRENEAGTSLIFHFHPNKAA